MWRAPWLLLAAALGCVGASGDDTEPPPSAAAPLDSATRVEAAKWDSALKALGDSAPAALDSIRRVIAFSAQMGLAELGYIGGPFDDRTTGELRAAIRAYERRRGLPETGDPMAYQFTQQLKRDRSRLREWPVLGPRVVLLTRARATASGAWVFDGMGSQRIAVEIRCSRASMECTESQAILRTFMDVPMLSAETTTWSIDSWDDVELAAHSEYLCTRYVLRLNRLQKSATKIRSTISADSACAYLDPEDVVVRLEDGGAMAVRTAEERRAAVESLLVVTPSVHDWLRSRGTPQE